MSIHSVFAKNLRMKTAEHGSIADVCRGVGINRQQFNKYLAGSSFPNALTMRKICTFLNIQEQSLFIDDDSDSKNSSLPYDEVGLHKGELLGFRSSLKKSFDFKVKNLPVGLYYCFVPLHNVPGMLVRSLIVITQNGKFKNFMRLTKIRSTEGGSKPLVRGRHTGIVCANGTEIYFIGFNRYANNQMSFMTMERLDGSSNRFFTGFIMTRNGRAMMSSSLFFTAADSNTTIKSAIRELGIIHESEAGLDSAMTATLFAKSAQ